MESKVETTMMSSHSSSELHSSSEILFSGTFSGVLTCDCSSSSSDEMLSRTDAALWWGFLDTRPDGYL